MAKRPLDRVALTLALCVSAPLACESPLLGEWVVEEARGLDYPIEEGGEACTTTIIADMDLRERSEGIGGTYYERTTRACFEQDFDEKQSWDVTIEEEERGLWIVDLEDSEAENESLECTLEDDELRCEDDSDDGGDWLFVRMEDED